MVYGERIEKYVKRFDKEGFEIVRTTIDLMFSGVTVIGEDSYKEIFILSLAKWRWIMKEFLNEEDSEEADPFVAGTKVHHGDACGLCRYFYLVNRMRKHKCTGCPLHDAFNLDLDKDNIPDCCVEFEAYVTGLSADLATAVYNRIEQEFLSRFPDKS